jgi:Mn2+/Fe2+ NRAMP family transporter
VGTGVVYDLFVVGHQSTAGVGGGLLRRFDGADSVVLAMGIIGATVMPHVVYLHSALAIRQARGRRLRPEAARRLLRLDCVLGLGSATIVNVSLIALGVGLAASTGRLWTGDLTAGHAALGERVGGAAALAFAIALLASGLTSSGVGTLAGEVVMSGFLARRVPLALRRMVTMAPAVAALCFGVPLTTLLIASQVVLSLGVPVALILLIRFCRDRRLTGALVNSRTTTVLATASTAVIGAGSVSARAARSAAACTCASTVGVAGRGSPPRTRDLRSCAGDRRPGRRHALARRRPAHPWSDPTESGPAPRGGRMPARHRGEGRASGRAVRPRPRDSAARRRGTGRAGRV